MSYVNYNGCRLIPAPYVGVSKSYDKAGDGTNIGSRYTLTIVGTVVEFMGSPRSASTGGTGLWGGPYNRFWQDTGYPADEVIGDTSRLASAMRKQEAIRSLFADEGQTLEFQSMDGSPAMKCNPRVVSIDFPEDIWYQSFRYTITLECDAIYLSSNNGDSILSEDGFTQPLSDVGESWQFETDETPQDALSSRTYRVSHTVSATGKKSYDSNGDPFGPHNYEPWEQARVYVQSRLGIDSALITSSGINSLPSYYQGFNHVKNESIDKKGGSYSVTESWILASGTGSNGYASESYTISVTEPIDSALTNVKIDGEIRGFELRNESHFNTITASKYYNADTRWGVVANQLLHRAQLYSGHTLNTVPLSKVKAVNPVEGVITYGYEYDNRASNIMSGTKSEVISVTHSLNVDAFASVFVLGRAAGPVLQSLGTKQAKTVDITIEIVLQSPTGLNSPHNFNNLSNYFTAAKPSNLEPHKSEINGILNANNPLNYGYSKAFVHNNVETWEPKTSRYSLQYGWTYE